jgi:hypothetical protein
MNQQQTATSLAVLETAAIAGFPNTPAAGFVASLADAAAATTTNASAAAVVAIPHNHSTPVAPLVMPAGFVAAPTAVATAPRGSQQPLTMVFPSTIASTNSNLLNGFAPSIYNQQSTYGQLNMLGNNQFYIVPK